ncbi:MAG TPA: LamG-like jellyroll fold domain-containing protein [Candidatus Acidoferrales bacterium]|nr:LamG-like jellyroll fold domain-containing protein [Candidatus Acidoferrales bacterium]
MSPLPTNQWVHVAVTYNGSVASLYTNGVLVESGAVSIPPTAFNPALNYLGESQWPSDPMFSGALDEVRVYNYALSGAQIAQLLTATTSIWSGGGADNIWSDGINWNNDVAPATSGCGVVFAGNTRLTPSMDSSYSVISLAFSNNASSFIIGATNGSTLTLAGGLTNNSANAQTLDVPITLSGAQTFNAASGSLILNSNIANLSGLTVAGISNVTVNGTISGGGGLTNADSGSLNLAGANNSVGGLIVTNGTLNITGGNTTLAATTPNSVGYESGAGSMNLSSGGIFTALGNVWVGGSDMTGSATGSLNISQGTAYFGGPGGSGQHYADGSLAIAASQNSSSSCSGTVTVNGGTVWCTNDLIVGYAGTGIGTLNISGTGIVNVGPVNGKWLSLGKWDTSSGVLNISGGNLNVMNDTAIKFSSGDGSNDGGGGTNTITQSGGTITFYSDAGTTVGGSGYLDLSQSASASAKNTYNLNGGTLIAPQITSVNANGTRVFNFNGGTLKAATVNANFMTLGTGNAVASVRNGGAIIDDGGYAITISQPLLHSTIAGDATVDGGLTKNGAGTLTLIGTNTYTGPTTITGGTFALSANASIVSSPSIFVSSGAILNVNGLTSVFTLGANQTLTGNGTVSGPATILGTIAPGIPIGTLTFGTAPTLNGTTLMTINRTNIPTADKIALSSGTLTYGGTLTVNNIGGSLQAGDSFQLFGAVSYGGTFAVTNLPGLSSGLVWSNSLTLNGTITVISTVSTMPTNIFLSVSGPNLKLSWPNDHTGWQLQVQTNTLTAGLGTNWVNVPGSTGTNQITIPINTANGSVFYRLVYP